MLKKKNGFHLQKNVLLTTILGKVVGKEGNVFLMPTKRYVLSRILPIFTVSLRPIKVLGSGRSSAVVVQTTNKDKWFIFFESSAFSLAL